MSGRKDFLSQPAPENYVAGLGRGATGFTTRSDLGPARQGPSDEQIKDALAKRAAQQGLAAPTAYGATAKKDDDDDDERFQDPDNESGLFAGGNYDKDDDEADRIYQWVDEKMANRGNRKKREAKAMNDQKAREEHDRLNPKISHLFAPYKRALETVTEEEWNNLPEVGDRTRKNKRAKQNLRQRYYAVPDSVIAGARDAGQLDTSISADDGQQANGGFEETDGSATSFQDIGEARVRQLNARLDQASASGLESVAGTATVKAERYMKTLDKSETAEFSVGDINRARELLESVIKTNPTHGPGWIAAARLEEVAGKIVAARNVIERGTELCPKDEDVWLERIRLNEGRNQKIIAASAIKLNDRSVRLWSQAAELENIPSNKKRVLQKAIDAIPKSIDLWKALVNLESDPHNAQMLLAEAVKKIPLSVDLWLAYARTSELKDAQNVLNQARQAVPTSHEIWLAACVLQEQLGKVEMISTVMKRAVKALTKENSMLRRDEWIREAEKYEQDSPPHPAITEAIIDQTIGWSLEADEDKKDVWLEDANKATLRGNYVTARAIYSYALRELREHDEVDDVWQAAVAFERNHGSQEQVRTMLEKAVEAVPSYVPFWTQLNDFFWSIGDEQSARHVLEKAFVLHPGNETIWLHAADGEAKHGKADMARYFLTQARDSAGTDRVYFKSVALERQDGRIMEALDIANHGLQLYPKCDKLWMQKGQIYESLSKLKEASEAFNAGTRACSKSVNLYLLAARLEIKRGIIVKARSILDRARLAVPKEPTIWREAVRLEIGEKNMQLAGSIMSQGLQQCPKSGILLAEKVWNLDTRTHRKARIAEAIKSTESNDSSVIVVAARLFWAERKLDKADSWFKRALLIDPDMGDTWAWYYKFLLQHGKEERVQEMIGECVTAEPRHGEVWQRIAKDPKNAAKNVEEILKMVAEELE